MSNRAEGRHIGAKGNGPNGISSHCASREGHAERAGQRLEILHAAPEGNNRDCREACGRRAGAHASSGKERRGRGENVRKIGCKRCRMTSECILEGGASVRPPQTVEKAASKCAGCNEGRQALHFHLYRPALLDGRGRFCEAAAQQNHFRSFVLQDETLHPAGSVSKT